MRSAVVLACAVLLLAWVPAGGQRPAPFVPVGVWYGGGTARPPIAPRGPASGRDAWSADLEAIRGLGFNSITGWVDWAGAEPRPGEYRFDALDQLLTLAGDAGLKAIVQLYPDVAPDWLGRRYPDALIASPSGGAPAPAATPPYCLDHPDVRASLASFIAAVSRRAAGHEAFHALDLWSAPRSDSPADARARDDGGATLCACPHTRGRFREWLQRKYGTLEALNAAWERTFTDWEDVAAAGPGPPSTYADAIDRASFAAVKQQEDLRFMALASAPRGARLTASHAAEPTVVRGLSTGSGGPDDWWMGSSVDHYGAAILPRPAASGGWPPSTLAAALDGIRSAGRDRGWWAARLQAGQGTSGARVSAPVTAEDVRLWTWAALSRGARAVGFFAWYPMRSGEDAHGYGLIDLDGRITPRARAAGRLAAIVSRNPALFAPLRPRPSRVAIVYNPLARLAGGRAATARVITSSALGFHRAMFERSIQVDFVHADEIAAGAGRRYRAIFLPAPLMLPRGVAGALAAYVQAGGTLISEARPAWSDERGDASARIPGLGLDEVFGARERVVYPAARAEFRMERELDGSLSPLAGHTIAARGPAEHLEISGASVRVVARFAGENGAPGDPAIVMSRHGQGRAILIGALPGAAFEEDPAEFRASGDLLAALAEDAGAAPDVRISGGAGLVEARYLESSEATVIIIMNHAETPRQVTLTFSPDTPEAIWLNLETGTSVHFVAGPDGPTWTHAFGPRDVAALMIRKEYR